MRGMSARSRNLPRRSCMSSPGSNERFLAKAPTVPADMSFLDLEDSVAPLEKVSARSKVVAAIRDQDWGERVLCVRVNAWDTEWTYGDVIEVVGNAGERLDELMLPKVQSAAEVVALDLLLTQVEKNVGLPVGHIGIEARRGHSARSHGQGAALSDTGHRQAVEHGERAGDSAQCQIVDQVDKAKARHVRRPGCRPALRLRPA